MGDLYKCKNCGQLLYLPSDPGPLDGKEAAAILAKLEKNGFYDSPVPVPVLESEFSEFLSSTDAGEDGIRYTAYPTFKNVMNNLRYDDVMIGSRATDGDQESVVCSLCGSGNHYQILGSLPTTEVNGVWDNYVETDHTWYILSDSLAGHGSITELEKRDLNKYITRENQADASDFVNQIMDKNRSSLEAKNGKIRQSDLDLISFFHILMTIKSGVWMLENRYFDLILRLMENDRQIVKTTCLMERRVIEQIEEKEEDIQAEIRELEKKQEFQIQPGWEVKYGCMYPEPVTLELPEEPQEPEYKTPSLFNRQKIQQENELLQQEYTEQREEYFRLRQEYEAAVAAYQKEVELYERRKGEILESEEALWKNSKPYLERTKKIAQLQKELDELEDVKKDAPAISKKLAEDIPLLNVSKMLREEGNENMALLKEAYKTEAGLQTLQFVLPKYLDVVAVTKIYEYLKSGRCTQLTGKDGAYILYDTELNSRKFANSGRDAILKQLNFQREITIYNIMSAVADVYNDLTEKTETIMKEMIRSAETDADQENYKKSAEAYYSLAKEKIETSTEFLEQNKPDPE